MSTRRRRLAAVLAVVALAATGVALLASGSGGGAPASRADRLVPADALLYLHASTDAGRDQDRALARLAARLPAGRALRERLEASLGAPGAFDLERDVRPWLGREAALAVTPRGTLALLAVDDRDRAQGVLRRVSGGGTGTERGGVVVQRFAGGAAAFVGGFLAVGPEEEVNRVIDLAAGRGRSLADRGDYPRVAAERREDRVLTAWAVPGARALAGDLGGRLPAAPALLTASPEEGGLRLDGRALGVAGPEFSLELLGTAPRTTLGYAGLPSLQPLADLVPRTGAPAQRFAAALQPLVDALDQEIALVVSPAQPDPIVTLTGRASRPELAREALGALQGVVAELLTGSETDTGLVPTFEERDLGDGLTGFALVLAGGGELVTGIREDRLAVSNAADGVRRALGDGEPVTDAERFGEVIPETPAEAQAIGFLDLSQLLALAERAGLSGLPGIEAAGDDLRVIRALGAVLTRQGDDTILEVHLRIP